MLVPTKAICLLSDISQDIDSLNLLATKTKILELLFLCVSIWFVGLFNFVSLVWLRQLVLPLHGSP